MTDGAHSDLGRPEMPGSLCFLGSSLAGRLSQAVEAREILATTGHVGHCLRAVFILVISEDSQPILNEGVVSLPFISEHQKDLVLCPSDSVRICSPVGRSTAAPVVPQEMTAGVLFSLSSKITRKFTHRTRKLLRGVRSFVIK